MTRLALMGFLFLFTACSSPPPKEPEAAVPGAAEPGAGVTRAAEVLGVGTDFAPKYTIVRTERFDFAGTPRLSMRVTVPRGLPRAELEANMRHALLRAYESGPVRLGAVSVLAYSSEKTDGVFDAASANFAPGGKWSAASTDVPLSSWQAQVTFADSYFQERVYLATGTLAVLVLAHPEFSQTIDLSRKAERWLAEDLLAELKPGVPVVIVGQKDFGIAGVRYEVKTTSGKKHRGWVHSFDLKAE